MKLLIPKICFITAIAGMVLSLYGADGIEILHPVDKKIYYEAYAGITVKVNDHAISRVEILTDRNEHFPVILTKECDNVCSKTIKLHPGENSVRVVGYKGEVPLYEIKTELYHVLQIKGFKDPPIKFTEAYFHTDVNEKVCAECHDMGSNEKKNIAFIDVEESNCYVCHKNITADKYAHAPAVNWLCTSCHNGKSGEKNSEEKGLSKYIVSKPIAPTCFLCHQKSKESWDTKKYKHLPVAAGRCTKCHNPHASNDQMFLRESVKTLCLECHGDKKLSAQMRGNSKCPGETADTCVMCHNPHASDHKFLLTISQNGNV